jgi:hypothetical protein
LEFLQEKLIYLFLCIALALSRPCQHLSSLHLFLNI